MNVSVVIPLYNKRPYVAEALESLVDQLWPGDELIVVNDASTDGSDAAARSTLATPAWRRRGIGVRVVDLPENRGPGAARNVGIELARGELITFLDADDCYTPDALPTIRAAIREHRFDLLVLGFSSDPDGESFPEAGAAVPDACAVEHGVVWLRKPLQAVCDPGFMLGRASNVVVRRALLGSERYCPGARLNEGVDFWYRIVKKLVGTPGLRAGLIHSPMIRFRLLADSLSHRAPQHWQDLEVPPIICRYLQHPDAADRRMAAMIAARWLEFASSAFAGGDGWPAFLAAHRDWLTQLGIAISGMEQERVA